jgi:AbrB family looped-hinge helix DNA binding protein
MKYMIQPSEGKRQNMDMVTLGERGQIVIPAAIRERHGLTAGDKLMAFSKHDVICLVPASNMRHMIEILTAQLSEIENNTNTNPNQEK